MLTDRSVVLVLKSFRLGGAERQALQLARHLISAEGARASIVGLSNPDAAVPEYCDRYGIPHAFIPFRLHGKRYKLIPSLVRLAWRLRRLRPEVLVPFLDVANIACGVLWRPVGAKASIWNQRDQGWSWRRRPMSGLALRRTPYFVANSRGGVEFLIAAGVNAERVRSLPNAVELPSPRQTRADWRRRLGTGDDCRVVVMVAHVHRRKDHPTLLEAWRRVVDRLGDRGGEAVLALAGIPGNAHDECTRLVTDLELEGSVRFLGEVRDVSGLLRASDLGVLSSHHEGCPNAVLEYMAAGLPVVGTNIPSIREILEPRFLAPAGDPEGWAERILTFLENEELRRDVGRSNLRRALDEYAPARRLAGWSELIERALA